jgi:spermidine synthase
MTDNPVWHETLHDQFGQYFAVDNVLYHEKTDHQDLVIFENAAFGRVMALDGVVQTTERDEFIYHEMMTHVPLLAHGHAKHVLIIGGGDGAMLREVSRHQSIETITMVEIDAGVVSAASICPTTAPVVMTIRALIWSLMMASTSLIRPRKPLM